MKTTPNFTSQKCNLIITLSLDPMMKRWNSNYHSWGMMRLFFEDLRQSQLKILEIVKKWFLKMNFKAKFV